MSALGCLRERTHSIQLRTLAVVDASPPVFAAVSAGADAFITGELSEPQAHYARECGVTFIACGHHASERYGAPATAAHVAAQLGIEHQFIEIDNPA